MDAQEAEVNRTSPSFAPSPDPSQCSDPAPEVDSEAGSADTEFEPRDGTEESRPGPKTDA